MSSDANLFAVLFPTEAEQIQQIAQRTGAPLVGPAVKTTAPVVPFPTQPTTAPSPVGGTPPLTMVQPVTPRALTAAYLAAQALGDATLALDSAPITVAAQGQAPYTFEVPANQVLVLLEPLTVQARRHSPAVTATVTVDTTPVLTNYALTHDEGVLLAAESVVTQAVTVQFQNGLWTNTVLTVVLSGVLVSVPTYQAVIAPILQGVVQQLGSATQSTTQEGSA